MKTHWINMAGLCGIISPIATLSLISLAIYTSPWFSWTENALSDLGVKGLTALIFNLGLILGGLLELPFSLGLRARVKGRRLGHIGSLALILSAISLSLIGLFPETAGVIHLYVSVSFFTFLPLSQLLLGGAMIQGGRKGMGLFSL